MTSFSVNTNEQALSSLRALNDTNSRLATTQNRITTGLSVSSARDNAAIFAIAQNLRAERAGLSAVQSSLDRALSTIDVALAAGQAVSDLLIEMRELAVASSDTGLDSASRIALNDEFTQLRDQITSIVDNAEFNGTNAVGGSSPDSIIAIINADATSTFSIAPQDLSLGGTIVSIAAAETITQNAASTVTDLDGSLSAVNSALSQLGAGALRLELQQTFVTSLDDTIEVGIGNLVDANLAEESAELQAIQVQQQLGLQALSIANQSPQSILSLFGG